MLDRCTASADRRIGGHYRAVIGIECRDPRGILGFYELKPVIDLPADCLLFRANVDCGGSIRFSHIVSGLIAGPARRQQQRCDRK